MTAFAEACRAIAVEAPRRGRPPGRRVVINDNPYGMTARELEVMALLVDGRRNREIAEILVVAEHTIKFHVAHAREKMGCRNRTEMAVRWVREQER
jgi:DNA-binding CsgD family transcriptional regulator